MTEWVVLREKIESKFPALLGAIDNESNIESLSKISDLVENALPKSFVSIYANCNGELPTGAGFIFGLSLLSTEKIIHELNVWRDIIDQGLEGLNESCSSQTPNAIKVEYANTKWLPLLGDGGGNFIGIDFDPAPSGTKGQIINFGRDEDDKFVFAKSLDDFLVLINELLKSPSLVTEEDGSYSYNHTHFIDALKELSQKQ